MSSSSFPSYLSSRTGLSCSASANLCLPKIVLGLLEMAFPGLPVPHTGPCAQLDGQLARLSRVSEPAATAPCVPWPRTLRLLFVPELRHRTRARGGFLCYKRTWLRRSDLDCLGARLRATKPLPASTRSDGPQQTFAGWIFAPSSY